MALKVSIRQAGRIAILDVDGPLRLGTGEEKLRDHLQSLLAAGTLFVAVNLARVSDMDSSGIGLLVRAFSQFKRAGGNCVFFSVSERVRSVLKMVRLDRIFDISENEAVALSRF